MAAMTAEAEGDHMRRRAVLCAAEVAEALVWSVRDGARVDEGQALGTAGSIERGNLIRLVAPCRGTLRMEVTVKGEEVEAEQVDGRTGERVVARVEYCIHPVRNGRVCLMCLAVVDEEEEGEMDVDDERKSVNVVSHGQVIRLNMEQAKKFDSENIKRQLAAKKLSLVLDLDHTLLHAVRVNDVVGDVTKTDDMHFFFLPGLPQQHVVKLRPGLESFLKQASSIYDLFVYTHGTRLYAEQIAKIIDPDDAYFHHRIVARTDTPDMVHKSLKLLFPSCDDSMIMVLDDRIDVWKENEGNVFLIEPYHFFKCTAEINNASGNGVLGVEDDGADEQTDNHLDHTLTVLKNVHESFYEGYDEGITGTSAEDQMAGRGRDVKAILSLQKRSVLQGCNIIFSGVFPLAQGRNCESHYLWRLAVELGATPSVVMNNFPITHLVIHPERLGTQKHVQARSIPGVFIVCPEWILKCARSWSRVPESDFLADEWKQKHAPPPPVVPQEESKPAAESVKPAVEAAKPQAGTEAADASVESVETSSVAKATDSTAQPVSKLVVGILVKDGATATEKEKKQVKFAEKTQVKIVESTQVQFGERKQVTFTENVVDTPTRFQHKVIRSKVIMRPRGPPRVIPTGTVASGGTFDFLSKIKKFHEARKDSKNPTTSGPKPPVDASVPKKTVRFEKPKKDVDDAFQRLIEAEERENALARKRKLDSTSLKDQLANRRRKTDAAPVPNKEVIVVDDSDDDDGDELDDLEADILGDM